MEDDFNENFEEAYDVEAILKDNRVQEILYDLKLKLANENYIMIAKNGINFEQMIQNGIDIEPTINTLVEMLQIFEDLEEYEKCALIKRTLDSAPK
jgi:hypothetical protein